MNKKAWWRSKTLWVNALALAALIIQSQPEIGFAMTPEKQVAILGVVNLALRLITGEAVGLHDDANPSTGPGEFPDVDAGGPGVKGS